MRDEKRIDEFCTKLAEYWHKVPDWRFFQLMENVFGINSGFFFFMEEEDAMKMLDKFFNKEGNK